MQIIRKSSLLWVRQGVLGFLLAFTIILGQGCQRTTEIKETPTVIPVEATQAAIKIVTENAGMYQVKAAELKKLGVESWLGNVSELRLYHRGIEQPLWTEGQGDDTVVTFYGATSGSIYTEENSYWLTFGEQISQKLSWGEGENIVSETGEPKTDNSQLELMASLPEGGNLEIRHIEENKVYAPLVEKGDHWFWDKISGKQKKTYAATLDEVLSGKGILRIAIWSATQAEISPDHHVIVTINDQTVIDESWDGSGEHSLGAKIDEGVLKNGENQVVISVPGDTGVRAETNHVNWIEIEYPRKLTAIDERIDFYAPKTQLSLDGFSKNVSVFDISDQKNITQMGKQGEVIDGAFSFTGEIGSHYLVVGSKGYLTPARLEIAQMNPDLRGAKQGADWIAVGPEELLEALQPLVEWRSKNGLTTQTIPVETIYDQFGYGLPEPEAIRHFIAYAMANWKPAPQYMVLLGDASYDPKGYLGNTRSNRLPTYLIQTLNSGETASDVKFIELGDNSDPKSLANLAIGRIPAQTEKQVKTIVEKIIQYESTKPTQNEASVLAVADGQEAGFAEAAQSFLDIFQNGYKTTLLAPEAGATDIPQQIVKNIKQNDFLVVYFGHGSINMWGKDMLFSTDNVKELSNLKHYPIMMNFTCLTGLFSHPTQESLTEALLWQADGGAVVVIAPTSLTLASDQSFLSRPLATGITQTPDATIGSLLQKVRADMAAMDVGVRDVMETFLLFGDPATRLMQP